MAKPLDFDLSPDGPPQAGGGRVNVEDRSRAFQLARRRTARVRLLRWVLPTISVALVGGYALTVLQKAGWGKGFPELSLTKILPEHLAMNNPRYEDFGSDGSSYSFTAKTARQVLATPSLINLDGISGTVIQPDKSKIHITATRGTFEHEKSFLELFDAIDVTSDGGLKAKLTHATIVAKEGLLISNVPVTVEFPSGNIRSKTMTLRQKAHEVTFADAVEARLIPPPAANPAQPAPSDPARATPRLFAASDAPIDIISERLDVNDVTKTAVFSGKVRAVQQESILSTPELEVHYDGAPLAGSAAQADAGGGAPTASKVQRIIARGPVVMTRDTPDVVTSDGAEFDAQNSTAILTGNVVMSSGEDRRATSQRADLDQRADTALLTGNVIVMQGRNQLHGRRLFLERKLQRAQLTAPAELGSGPGRITARFYQGAPADEREQSDKPAQSGGGFGSFKTDPKAPVDVEADRLDIDDAAHTAVFRGTVKAMQGDFVIASSELHAFYTGEGGLGDVSSQGRDASKPAESAELTRIEARNNVEVTSKRGQTVTGDWAKFDAKTNKMTVGGEVVVSQDESVVRGTRLVIDMTSGQSTIDTAPLKAAATPSGGGWVTEAPDGATPANRGRASAVFFPHKVKGVANGTTDSGSPSNSAPNDDNAGSSSADAAEDGN